MGLLGAVFVCFIAADGRRASFLRSSKSTGSRKAVTCVQCHVVLLKKNLHRHMTRHHQPKSRTPLPSALVCPKEGIYMCAKSALGSQYPVHVQMKTTGSKPQVSCEHTECQNASAVAHRSRFGAFQCPYLQATVSAQPLPTTPPLDDSVLQQLVAQKLVRPSTVKSVTSLRNSALKTGTPPAVWWQPTPGGTYGYISVYAADVHHYSKLCRVIVRVCTSTAAMDCACCTRKVGCVHKKMALWYVAQTMPDMLQSKDGEVATDRTDATTDALHERQATVSSTQSPPTTYTAAQLKRHLLLMREHHSIPADIKCTPFSDKIFHCIPQSKFQPAPRIAT